MRNTFYYDHFFHIREQAGKLFRSTSFAIMTSAMGFVTYLDRTQVFFVVSAKVCNFWKPLQNDTPRKSKKFQIITVHCSRWVWVSPLPISKAPKSRKSSPHIMKRSQKVSRSKRGAPLFPTFNCVYKVSFPCNNDNVYHSP